MGIIEHYVSLISGQHLKIEEVFSEEERNRIYYVLSRQEEIDNPIRNKWGNWRFSYTNEKYDEPYLDQFVIDILKRKNIQRKSIWPNEKKFAVWLTHDVDAVTQCSSTFDYRFFKRRKNNGALARTYLKRIFEIKKNDPLWHFEDWLKTEDQHGFKSTFFFFVMPDEKNVWIRDCLYTPDDYVRFSGKKMKMKEMIQEIHKAGWEIGLHASYNTFNNAILLKRQKAELENIIGCEVVSVRQHYLHYDVSITPKIHNEAGFKIDSTQGFARTLGFRAGTCFPYLTYDHKNKKTLDTIEVPMIIMDDPLFNDDGLELFGDYALRKCIDLTKKIEVVGGILTINFHTNHINQKDWFSNYQNLLEILKEQELCCLQSNHIYNTISKNINV